DRARRRVQRFVEQAGTVVLSSGHSRRTAQRGNSCQVDAHKYAALAICDYGRGGHHAAWLCRPIPPSVSARHRHRRTFYRPPLARQDSAPFAICHSDYLGADAAGGLGAVSSPQPVNLVTPLGINPALTRSAENRMSLASVQFLEL